MPFRPASPCCFPGCPGRAGRNGYCEAHARQRRQAAQRQHDAKRPSASARGYDAAWSATRARYIREHPNCEGCGRPAQVVDHIVSLRRGGDSDPANLMSLCRRCHGAKSAAVDGAHWPSKREATG